MDFHVSRSTHCRFIGILANRSVLARSHSVDLWIPSCDDFQRCLLDFYRVSVAHGFSSHWMPCESFGALFTYFICEHVGYQKGETVTTQPNKSPEPTAVGAGSSAIAVHVTSRRWLSFLR
jgi:hypothetical protein